MRKKRFSALALAATALGTAVLTLAVSTLGLLLFMGRPGLGVAEAMGLIHTQFVGEGDVQAAADKGMSALVTGLEDRWSYYVDEAGLGRLRESQNNAYVGIGVTVEYRGEEGATIIKVTAGGPADTAGLRVGDVILTVNTADEEGQPLSVRLTGEDRSRAPELIRGPAGSEIELQVRAADGAERWMNITRGRVEEDPVTYALLEDGTGLVTIKNFNRRCADGAIAAVDDLIDQGATQLVFDVRNNGGGYLDELTRLLDHLLPEGVIFRTSDKAGRTSSVRSDAGCVDLPMAVLVNGETYSASE